MARAKHKSTKVLIRCAAPGCTRRVRRKPHSGPRYCGRPSCKQRAFRARQSAQHRALLEQSRKAERERLKALESARAQLLAENFHSGMKTMMRYAFTAQEKEAMRDIDRRERAALRSAAGIEDLGRIKQEHEAARAPLIKEASKRPPRGPSASALRAAAIMEAEKKRRPRRPPPATPPETQAAQVSP